MGKGIEKPDRGVKPQVKAIACKTLRKAKLTAGANPTEAVRDYAPLKH